MIAFVLLILVSLIFPGIIVRTKAIFAGRKGPNFWQPIRDIIKLFKKGSIYSKTTSFVFQIAPVVYMSSVLVAALFIPLGKSPSLLSFDYDFVVLIYILALGKFLMIIAAMDTGSAFEGMGASREALYSMLVEPAFFVLLATFALLSGNTSFSSFIENVDIKNYLSIFIGLLAAYNVFHIALLENSRMPYDDPKTHLELTMIHEVMVLDNSGFDLALIQITSNLKFAIYSLIVANFVVFSGTSTIVMAVFYLFVGSIFAFAVGLMESFRARHKLRNNNKAIVILTPISVLIFFAAMMLIQKIL